MGNDISAQSILKDMMKVSKLRELVLDEWNDLKETILLNKSKQDEKMKEMIDFKEQIIQQIHQFYDIIRMHVDRYGDMTNGFE